MKKNEPLLKGNNENIDDIGDYLDTLLGNFTVEQVKNFTPEEVEKIYTMDALNDGDEPVVIDISTDKGKSDFELKKDYLIFRKETNESMKAINESTKELQNYMVEYQEEMNQLMEEFGSMDRYIIDSLNKKIEANVDSPDKIALFTKIRDSYNEAFTLESLTKYVKSYKGKNILLDFLNYDNSIKIYKRYLKISKKVNIEHDITKYSGFETYLYDTEQIKNVRVNIFAFAVIHYIASQKYDDLDKYFGIFISQLTVNMKNVIYNNFPSGDSHFTFMNAVRNIIQIIG